MTVIGSDGRQVPRTPEGATSVSDETRARLGRIADDLIPAAEGMPAATEVDVQGRQLDLVLRTLPDLAPHLERSLSWDEPPESGVEWIRQLQADDPDAYFAVAVAIVGAYYTHPEVKRRLDYPGQVGQEVLIGYPEYVEEGLLDGVLERGPIYREVPEN
ncbi:MAG TPA: hypothetical protein VHI54_08870 [Actinomycetota bacterium]|nr:hypothetical protein [Actinomycetota bacterium]